MKRKLCFVAVMALAVVFSLSGCQSTQEGAVDAGGSDTEVVTEAPTEAVTEAPTETVTEAPKNDEEITLAEYEQIQNDMTYEEVVNIVGSAGTETVSSGYGEYSMRMISWDGNGMLGSNANVTFMNNKVTSKAQFGLE